MMKLMESQIPQNYSTGLYSEKDYDVSPDFTNTLADILFTGVAMCLGDVKDRKFPSVFVFEENNSDFIAAAIVEYFENEDDPSKPGNWNYTWTWYKDDVPANSKIYRTTQSELSSYFRGVSQGKYGMAFRDVAGITEVNRYFLIQVKKWLDENAKEGEEVGVEEPGIFQASVVIEDGEKVFSLVPEGEIKKLIKDDSAIEV
jgi:hypothetical protein